MGENKSADSKSAEEFSEEFNRLVAEHNFTPNHIIRGCGKKGPSPWWDEIDR